MSLHDFEKERMKVLKELDLLNKDSLKMFDDITTTAAFCCNTPIALVSLITTDKQIFKSRFGLETAETPIEQSFCKHAIDGDNDIFGVENAKEDQRFKDNPLVCGAPNITSYYGVPIKTKLGIKLGTLCVIDNKKNILSEKQKQLLQNLANQIEHLIELMSVSKKVKTYQSNIESYSKRVESFSSIALHDLKSPLRGINSFIQVIDKKHKTLWDKSDRVYFDFIYKSVKKMTQLTTDIFEYTKLNATQLILEEFDLKKLVEEIFKDLTFNLTEKPTLICNHLPTIKSSKIAFSVLFNNLINNAIKYHQEEKKIVIEIEQVESDKYWWFTVKDNGIGIEERFFDTIFEPFKRLHASKEFEGSGLGLSNCRKVVEKLNGEISVDSELGVGTMFSIKIPKEHKSS